MINSRKFDDLQFFTSVIRHEHRRVTRHHSTHFSHDRSRSIIVTRRTRRDHSSILRSISHDRSSSLEAFVTITHHHSKHSSRSLIITRRTRHDYSSLFEAFITIAHRHSRYYSTLFTSVRHQLKLWRIDSSKLAQIFKRKVLSRFQIKDLFVRFVSTRYESRHSNILRLRFSIYILQHVSRSQHS